MLRIYDDQGPSASAPGSYFYYGNTHLRIAARMAEVATGKGWNQIYTEQVRTPLGFGALSLYGYTTQRDLSPIGSFLIMGLFGLILAMLVNMFLKSTGLDFAISAIGVLIFAGLTAWDTQRIKEMYSAQDDGTIAGRKAVMGALTLYLDFINLFLFLLRFLGDRR